MAFSSADRISRFGRSFWAEFYDLTAKYNAVNLGLGFPNFDSPQYIKDAAVRAINSGHNQYTRSAGHLRLVKALAAEYSPLLNHKLDPLTNVLVTVGAAGAFHSVSQALLNPGDSVILLEPFFDFFRFQVELAGGHVIGVPLRCEGDVTKSENWKLNMVELEAAITKTTRIILVNSPMNPMGKRFSKGELEEVAAIAIKHNLIVVSDDVYERIVFDDKEHVRIATLPGMWERTLTIGSAGKTFSATGWKLGWVLGPENLINYCTLVQQYDCYSLCTPLQEALAIAFEDKEESKKYFRELSTMLQAKRDLFVLELQKLNIRYICPEGAYFVLVDTSNWKIEFSEQDLHGFSNGPSTRDFAVCRFLTRAIGLAAVPTTPFFSEEHKVYGENYIRFCFAKTDELLHAAIDALQKLKPYISAAP